MMTRRNFLTKSIAMSCLSPVLFQKPMSIFANDNQNISFKSSICSLCPIGCGITFGQELDKNTIQIKGDKTSLINHGSLCKRVEQNNNFINTIDRVKTPLLRLKDGTHKVLSWGKAFLLMEEKSKLSLKNFGVDGLGLALDGYNSIEELYAINKLFKGGFRTNNITLKNFDELYANYTAQVQVFGIDGTNGSFEDLSYCDAFISWDLDFSSTIFAEKITQIKQEKKENFSFINITTNEQNIITLANLNILIQPNSEISLVNYLIRKYLNNYEEKIDWELLKNRTIFAAINTTNRNIDDKFEQWEISYPTYKKYFQKYTLEYLYDNVKTNNESHTVFKQKIEKLTKLYLDNMFKTLSYLGSNINQSKDAIDTNILFYSLHLLINKHSRPGCGAFSINELSHFNHAAIQIGNFSNRLPNNMYIAYKEHRVKTEALWQIPENTLNPVATTNNNNLFTNVKNERTKFLWLVDYKLDDKEQKLLENTEDIFIVSSNSFHKDIPSVANLILPTATPFEKHFTTENFERKIQFSEQHIVPYGESMSLLWQTIEFSKRFKLKDVWKDQITSTNQLLKNVLPSLNPLFHDENTTLYKVLFANKKAKSFELSQQSLNSEVKSDQRDILGTNEIQFYGYKFFIQKYLFEEFREFGLGNGYDLASYEQYEKKLIAKWPIVFNKETNYRFNPIDDIYALKASKLKDKYIFYGKMGGKLLPFGDEKEVIDKTKKELKFRAKIFILAHK